MPTRDEHVRKAQENQAFNDEFDSSTQARIDWKLVVYFYTAMHYVEAYLAKTLGMHGRSHTTRDNYIAREAGLKQIGTEYMHLKYYGYNARYEPPQFNAQDVKDAEGYLTALKAKLLPML